MGVLTRRVKRLAVAALPGFNALLGLAALGLAMMPAHGDPASGRAMVWGIGGHPTWSDYADWVPANTAKEMGYIRELGCTYYRCSFEGADYPSILQSVVPAAQAAGITVLPDLHLKIVAGEDAKTNYARNYKIATEWASYAISKHDELPYWELGNELENSSLVKVIYDGTTADQFPDKTPGGFIAIAGSLNGAYHGLRDAYAAGRKRGETTITPKILYGCAYHHWGLLSKIQKYLGSLPCDMISWHWYEPNCGLFMAPINDPKSPANGRRPVDCLADFKSHTNPGQPMEVWITELNRSLKVKGGKDYLNGSVADSANDQTYADQAATITTAINDVKSASTVTGIFVYELFDETRADGNNPVRLHSEGYFGLMTGLDGTRKDAFTAYQNEIRGTAAPQQ
jgi:hypothetical protein